MEGMRRRCEDVFPFLDERQRRLWAAAEVRAAGYGGVAAVARVTGLSRATIGKGLRELLGAPEKGAPAVAPSGQRRIRAPGAGRKPIAEKDPLVVKHLEAMVDPVTRGDPMSLLRWTCKSTIQLAGALREQGHRVGRSTVSKLLRGLGYRLQSPRKTREGTADHPDRNAQFQYINDQAADFAGRGLPVVSVDTKKKELVGQFKNGGKEWRPRGVPFEVNVHDFPDDAVGKAIPYGVYDVYRNEGWVSVGIDHDTADFAVASIRSWWYEVGATAYPNAEEFLITADCGGSNGYRLRAWKVGLQRLADELRMAISVCHFPPGTSKWNKIEHRMFCHITRNWRGQPLVSHQLVLNLIAGTTTRKGLRISASLDRETYPTGISIPDAELRRLNIERGDFHGEWNYKIRPGKLHE